MSSAKVMLLKGHAAKWWCFTIRVATVDQIKKAGKGTILFGSARLVFRKKHACHAIGVWSVP